MYCTYIHTYVENKKMPVKLPIDIHSTREKLLGPKQFVTVFEKYTVI